jgi:hypothetical protein
VQALVEAGSPRAAPVLKSLIAYLRAAMPRLHDGRPRWPRARPGARLPGADAMRMPDRLQFAHRRADASLQQRPFPPMALLTLVENAVRHGIDPCEDGGRIGVGAWRARRRLRLWVADTGVGIDPQMPARHRAEQPARAPAGDARRRGRLTWMPRAAPARRAAPR